MQIYSSDTRPVPTKGDDQFWRKFQGCIDYEVFICDLPDIEDREWASAVVRMRTLGDSTIDVCGITTVKANWGFFLIPGPGYPELKITFFQITPSSERRRVLGQLASILDTGQKRSWCRQPHSE